MTSAFDPITTHEREGVRADRDIYHLSLWNKSPFLKTLLFLPSLYPFPSSSLPFHFPKSRALRGQSCGAPSRKLNLVDFKWKIWHLVRIIFRRTISTSVSGKTPRPFFSEAFATALIVQRRRPGGWAISVVSTSTTGAARITVEIRLGKQRWNGVGDWSNVLSNLTITPMGDETAQTPTDGP